MKLYRFSPIGTKDDLVEAVGYVVKRTTLLATKLIGHPLPINSMTIFAHYPGEYDFLAKMLGELGEPHGENNGPRVALHHRIVVGSTVIRHLRVRQPDPYRMQVGCNDFMVEDYQVFKNQHLTGDKNGLRLIERPEYEMIEFFDPDFDVLAYVVGPH